MEKMGYEVRSYDIANFFASPAGMKYVISDFDQIIDHKMGKPFLPQEELIRHFKRHIWLAVRQKEARELLLASFLEELKMPLVRAPD